jgi:hypothetical protein
MILKKYLYVAAGIHLDGTISSLSSKEALSHVL